MIKILNSNLGVTSTALGDTMGTALERLATDTSSWYWWLTAVFLAITLNVASSYIKIGLDGYFAKRKGRLSQKRTQRMAAMQRQAIEMAAQHRVLQFEFQRETRMWFLTSLLVVLALALISSIALLNALVVPAPEWLPNVFSAIGIVASLIIAVSLVVSRELFWQTQKTFIAEGLLLTHSLDELRQLADEEHSKYFRLPENMRRVWPQ